MLQRFASLRPAALAPFAAALLGSAALTGCEPISLFEETRGNEGELVFSYGGEAFLDCLFGCTIDRPMMTGTSIRIVISEADPAVVLTARSSSPIAAVDSLEEHLRCVRVDEGSDREVTRAEPCVDGEERRIIWIANVTAVKKGSFDLELRDGDDLVDSMTLRSRDAAAVQLRRGSGDDGNAPITELRVGVGETAILAPTFVDETGAALASGVTGEAWAFADESIARRGSPLNLIFGPWNGLVIDGVAPGTTTSSIPGLASTLTIVVE